MCSIKERNPQTNEEAIESTVFELILPSAGAAFDPEWGSSKLEKLPPPVVDPKVYPLDSDTESTGATGEPSNKRARQDHDNTYDGSDDSMA